MNQNDDIDSKLLIQLEGLRATPTRNPQQAARARAAFLSEAGLLARTAPVAKQSPFAGWKNIFAVRRLTPAVKFALITLLAVGIVLGSGSLTVTAAQGSQPNQALYPVKTWSEDLRLSLAQDPDSQLQLDMEFAGRRMDEIQAMLQAGDIPPETVLTRLETQVENALEVAASLPDERATPALLQISDHLHTHEQNLRQQHVGMPAAQEIQARVQTMLAINLQLAEAGAAQPGWLRLQIRQRRQTGQPGIIPTTTPLSPEATATTAPGNGQGYGQSPTPQKTSSATPAGNGHGFGGPHGPPASVTSTPNGNGPGQPRRTPASTDKPSGPGEPKQTPSRPGKTPSGPNGPQNTPANPQDTPSGPGGPKKTPSSPGNGNGG